MHKLESSELFTSKSLPYRGRRLQIFIGQIKKYDQLYYINIIDNNFSGYRQRKIVSNTKQKHN